MADDYRALNHANWQSRVPHHVAGYDLQRFYDDPTAVSNVVAFDRHRLGSIEGLDVVHLQCHIGTDTLSLARLGAASVTGLDFSADALAAAQRLAADTGAPIDFVEADLYDAVDALGNERFDLVYTGVGAINWLPSISKWADVVARLLRPGGALFMREGHPVLEALDDPRSDGLVAIEYPYFETAEGTTFVETTSYVDHEGDLTSPTTVQFNHGIAEVFNALWSSGMTVDLFVEHDSAPWAALGNQMEQIAPGEFRLIDRPERLPHSYTIRAVKASVL